MKVSVGIGVGPDLDLGVTDDFRLVVTKGDEVRLSLGTFNQKRLDFLIECLQRLKIHLPGGEDDKSP